MEPNGGAPGSASAPPPPPAAAAPAPAPAPATPATTAAAADPPAQIPPGALPPRLDRLRQRTVENPLDYDAWRLLATEYPGTPAGRADPAAVNALFERIVRLFPYGTRIWSMYIDFTVHTARDDHEAISRLFARSLRAVHSLDLYRVYLQYIRKQHPFNGSELEVAHARSVVIQAYEFVLGDVAHDRDVGPLWLEYIALLKTVAVSNQFEEQRKLDELSAVYQRAIAFPHANVEPIWREWEVFENGRNKLAARKIIQDRVQTFVASRNGFRALRSFWDAVDKFAPVTTAPTFASAEKAQLAAWRALIDWEKGNALKIDDPNVRYARVAWAYWQAIGAMTRFPELWYEFAAFASAAGRPDDALNILKSAADVCDGSYLVHFSLADMYEAKGDKPNCTATYERLVAYWTAKAETLIKQHALTPEEAAALPSAVAAAQGGTPIDTERLADADRAALDEARHAVSLAWIMYMRMAARTGGVGEMRGVFRRARNPDTRTWQVIVASALLEYHRGPSESALTVPKKIFAFACQAFPADPAPVLAFADWLLGTRDHVNAVSTLVKAINSPAMPDDAKRVLAHRLARVHAEVSDLRTLAQFEAEIQAQFPAESNTVDHARRRYAFMDLDLVAARDLGLPAGPAALASALAFSPDLAAGLGGVGESVLAKTLARSGSSFLGLNLAATSGQSGSAPAVSSSDTTNPAQQQGDDAGSGRDTPRRRVLDDWVAPAHVAAPDVSRASGWAAYRPPRMTDDEERALNDRHRQLVAAAMREEREMRQARAAAAAAAPPAARDDDRHRGPASGGPAPPPPVNPTEVLLGHVAMLPPAADFIGPFVDVVGLLRIVGDLALPPPGAYSAGGSGGGSGDADRGDPRRRKRPLDDPATAAGGAKRYRS
ncbi:mRNA 3'-end-processing protein rna14 [Blastocladiella emersonii ATCC 22665]|nr:mRNA 3'-end-processing protein rna14 [Blastocladiella emersonii ATCC 22665]